MNPPLRSRRRPVSMLLVTATVALLALGVGSAGAASIEGVWSFGGGQIAVQPASGGTFAGIVVAATTFAECVHPVGQEIWKEMHEQSDGSYWGLHQWYFEGTCALNPTLGPTAWRVLEEPDGSKYLRVCFSDPGTSQPTIAPDGASAGATYGCVSSALTAPLPQQPTSTGPTTSASGATSTSSVAAFIQRELPSAKQCLSGRHFEIHLAEPKYDPFKTVRVTLKGHAIRTERRGDYVVADISLKGLPPGAFTLEIHATTVLGVNLHGSRTYHTCAAKPKKHKPSRLKVSGPVRAH
jgi:hypothetical protein